MLFELDLDAGLGLFASSPLTAASDSSSAPSGRAPCDEGASRRRPRRPSPFALRSIRARTSSRYSSRYWEASNSPASESISALAISSPSSARRPRESRPRSPPGDDLVGEPHRRHGHHRVHRPQRRRVLLVAEHEARDRHLAGVLHRLDEQRVGLPRRPCRGRGSRGDRSRSGRSRRGRRSRGSRSPGSSSGRAPRARQGDDHVLLGGDLVPLDDVLVGDLLVVGLRDALWRMRELSDSRSSRKLTDFFETGRVELHRRSGGRRRLSLTRWRVALP